MTNQGWKPEPSEGTPIALGEVRHSLVMMVDDEPLVTELIQMVGSPGTELEFAL